MDNEEYWIDVSRHLAFHIVLQIAETWTMRKIGLTKKNSVQRQQLFVAHRFRAFRRSLLYKNVSINNLLHLYEHQLYWCVAI